MKKVFLLSILLILFYTGCKKDPSLSTTTNNKTTTNTVTASYNITYHLWYPYQTITMSIPYSSNPFIPTCIDTSTSLLISLDSTTRHKIKLILYANCVGVAGGPLIAEYDYEASVLSKDSNVFIASHKYNNTNILTNDWINDSLKWAKVLDLRDLGNGGGGPLMSMGDWDNGSFVNYGVNDGFVGIKIKTPLGYEYGWIRLYVPNSTTMTMKAQALNKNYGQYIQAGQTH